MKRAFVLVAVLLAACGAAEPTGVPDLDPPADGGACQKDTDCPGSSVCVAGACVASDMQATGCQKDTDCKGARICVGGVCQDPPDMATWDMRPNCGSAGLPCCQDGGTSPNAYDRVGCSGGESCLAGVCVTCGFSVGDPCCPLVTDTSHDMSYTDHCLDPSQTCFPSDMSPTGVCGKRD